MRSLISKDPDADAKIAEVEEEISSRGDYHKCQVIAGSMGSMSEFRDSMAVAVGNATPAIDLDI